jgi:2-polyprenyl-3-methyl-5-hydroxy-6-metoxy-1,4-benzoquinol methylase
MAESVGKKHWTRVYEDKSSTDVSWYQQQPEPSLLALQRLSADPKSPFIDIGGGASNLVDALVEDGWQDVTVLDIAESALNVAKSRLGSKGNIVHWLHADITQWKPDRAYSIWHDRAVFHFMTTPAQREAYTAALDAGVAAGGAVIMATFALDGPERCSGLPVQRYNPEQLALVLGRNFNLTESWRESHLTPWGSSQSFNWCVFRRL